SLTEHWSRTPDVIEVGDSLTRTLTIKALGLEGSQLPPLAESDAPQIKLYPEQPQIDTETHADGVTGTRIQRTAVVAVKGGEVQLPEIRLPWWDTLSQEWREAIVPARTLRIGSGVTTPEPSPAEPVEAQADQPLASPETSATGGTDHDYFWPLLSLVLVVGW